MLRVMLSSRYDEAHVNTASKRDSNLKHVHKPRSPERQVNQYDEARADARVPEAKVNVTRDRSRDARVAKISNTTRCSSMSMFSKPKQNLRCTRSHEAPGAKYSERYDELRVYARVLEAKVNVSRDQSQDARVAEISNTTRCASMSALSKPK